MQNAQVKEQQSIAVLIGMGLVAKNKKSFERAHRLFNVALRNSMQAIEYKKYTVLSATYLADTYFEEANYEKAEICYIQAHKFSCQFFGESTMAAATLLAKLIYVNALRLKLDQFESLFEKMQLTYLLSKEQEIRQFLNVLIDISWALCIRRKVSEARLVNNFISQIKEAENLDEENIKTSKINNQTAIA